MGKSRLGQVWAARQYAKNRPWQRARDIRRLQRAELEAKATGRTDGSGEETIDTRGSEDFEEEESDNGQRSDEHARTCRV